MQTTLRSLILILPLLTLAACAGWEDRLAQQNAQQQGSSGSKPGTVVIGGGSSSAPKPPAVTRSTERSGSMLVKWSDGSTDHGLVKARPNSNGRPGGTFYAEPFTFVLSGDEEIPFTMVARAEGMACEMTIEYDSATETGGSIRLWDSDGEYKEGRWDATTN